MSHGAGSSRGEWSRRLTALQGLALGLEADDVVRRQRPGYRFERRSLGFSQLQYRFGKGQRTRTLAAVAISATAHQPDIELSR